MQTTVNRSEALAGIETLQRVTAGRCTIPILGHVLITANGKTELQASDQETWATVTLDSETTRDGQATADCKLLAKLIKGLRGDRVSLEYDSNQKTAIGDKKTRFAIEGLAPSDFPAVPQMANETPRVEVDGAELYAALGKVAYAMSEDATRFNLNGLHVEHTAGKLTITATDGHRLTQDAIACDSSGPELPAVIWPAAFVAHVQRAVKKARIVRIACDDAGRIYIQVDNVELGARKVEGEFPDMSQVIPGEKHCPLSSYGRSMRIPAAELLEALARVSLVAKADTHGVAMTIADGHLELDVTNVDVGKAQETLDCFTQGERLRIGYNAAYWAEMLKTLPKDATVEALWRSPELKAIEEGADVKEHDDGPVAPCLVRIIGDAAWLSVIMPMRL